VKPRPLPSGSRLSGSITEGDGLHRTGEGDVVYLKVHVTKSPTCVLFGQSKRRLQAAVLLHAVAIACADGYKSLLRLAGKARLGLEDPGAVFFPLGIASDQA